MTAASFENLVELSTGVTLRYGERGNPSGIPLLLLPGLGDTSHSFKPVLEHLPDSIRAFALTQRGHGDSTHPRDGYRFHDFAADLEAFMDALDLPAAVSPLIPRAVSSRSGLPSIALSEFSDLLSSAHR